MIDLTPSLEPEPLCDACGSDRQPFYLLLTRSEATGQKKGLALCETCLGEMVVAALVLVAMRAEKAVAAPQIPTLPGGLRASSLN